MTLATINLDKQQENQEETGHGQAPSVKLPHQLPSPSIGTALEQI